MEEYYDQMDTVEKRRIREQAKQKFHEIMMNHKKFKLAEDKLKEAAEALAAAAEEQKRGIVEEENHNKKQMEKLQTWEDKYTELINNKR